MIGLWSLVKGSSQEHRNEDMFETRLFTKNTPERSRKTHCVRHRPRVSCSTSLYLQATKDKQSSERQGNEFLVVKQTSLRNHLRRFLSRRNTQLTSRANTSFFNNFSSRAFAMDDPDVKKYAEVKLPCHRFAAAGNCSGCQNEHHPNLNPALVGMVVPQQYRVHNEVGVACQGCIDNLREASCTHC